MPSAGEVEQFAYCPQNWWLARQGVDPHDKRSRQGMATHDRLAAVQDASTQRSSEGHRALRWMFRVLGLAASATFLGIELAFLRANPLHWLLLLTAVVMVSASAALLIIASIMEREAKRGVASGAVPGARSTQAGDVLQDLEWGVTGTPDSMLETEAGPVPVEVKTGHTPEAPFESHVMQLAVYMRLLEANGRRPDYGLITYPDGVFRVPYDEDVQGRLRSILARMQTAAETRTADRDHEHAGRCAGCARRDACTQRLV